MIAESRTEEKDVMAKTQFLFKINKGVKEVSDNKRINEFIPEEDRPIPFENMIYFGDGETDIPCMKMIKEHGGHSIAVYGDKKKKETALKLIKENRVNFVCPADYTKEKEMYNVVKTTIDKIKSDFEFNHLQDTHKSKIKIHLTKHIERSALKFILFTDYYKLSQEEIKIGLLKNDTSLSLNLNQFAIRYPIGLRQSKPTNYDQVSGCRIQHL
jgi:hypothetical protein